MAAGVSPFDLTKATQQREVQAGVGVSRGHASGREVSAEPTERPDVEPTERPEVQPRDQAAPPVANPSPVASGSTATATFSLIGGTVTVSCPSFGSIMVDLVAPNPGFSVRTEREDNGQTVEIRFEADSHESRLQATCAGARVVALELREGSS